KLHPYYVICSLVDSHLCLMAYEKQAKHKGFQMKSWFVLVFGLVVALVWFGWEKPQRSAVGAALITLNPKTKFQTISGWEATAEAGAGASAAFPKYKDLLFNQAVNYLGINRLRLEIKSGAEDRIDY